MRCGRRTGPPGWRASTGRASASIQSGGIEAPPSEVGPIQVLAKALHVRFRAEVAERKFDDAIRTAKTMFALSRHLGEHPTEVANLVGPLGRSPRRSTPSRRWCSRRSAPTFTGP